MLPIELGHLSDGRFGVRSVFVDFSIERHSRDSIIEVRQSADAFHED